MDRSHPFTRTTASNMKQPRFSIHDAFEEENDEAIRVYGSTVVSNVPRPNVNSNNSSGTGNNNAPAGNNGGGGASSSVSSVGSVSNNTTTNELSTLTCDR